MALMQPADGAFGLLSNSPGTGGTSAILSSGQGGRFPSPATYGSYVVFIRPNDTTPSIVVGASKNTEVALATALSGDTFTLTRNYDGNGTVNAVAGYQLFQGPSANAMLEVQNRLAPIWIPAVQWGAQQAGTTLAARGTSTGNAFNIMQSWDFDTTNYEAVGTLVIIPSGFIGKTVQAIVHYALSAGGAGDWVGALATANMNGAQDIDRAADNTLTTTFLAGPAANSYAVTNAGTFVPTTKYQRLAFGRTGPVAGDTYASDIWFLGLELTIA